MYDTASGAQLNTTLGTPGFLSPGNSGGESFRVEHPIGMNLMLMSDDGSLQNFYLPYPPRGRYPLGADGCAYLEAVEGSWVLYGSGTGAGMGYPSGNGLHLTGNSGRAKTEGVRVYNQCMLPVQGRSGTYMLYAEEVNRESYAYHNYIVLASTEIRIGRAQDNDIVCPETMVSRYHASLFFDGKKWRIKDVGSANGVYVNGKRVQECSPAAGDVIHIMGLRMIIGSGFLSVNDGNGRLSLSPEKLMRVKVTQDVMPFVFPDPFRKRPELFNRFPRHRLALEEKEIDIESPPAAMSQDGMPLLMRSGNSMIMGGTAALTGNVAMLATSLLLPVLSRQYTKEEKEEYEKKRQKKYREYLDLKWQEILDEKKSEETVLNANYPPFPEVLSYAGDRTGAGEKLWERRKTDDDFLTLRIGKGSIPMKAQLRCAKRRFEMESDKLRDEMYALTEKEVFLDNVPILQDLQKDPVWGVTGDREMALQFARTMLMRLSFLYSYDELKIVFLAEPGELKQMEFVRCLPHLWDDQRSIRFLATDIPETSRIGEHIAKSLGEDLKKPRKFSDMMKQHPYYVVFALNRRLFEGMEMLKSAMQQDGNCGVGIFAIFDNVPKECSLLIKMSPKGTVEHPAEHTVVYLKQPEKKEDSFMLDSYDDALAERSMRKLANTSIGLVSRAYALPRTLTFLEMLGVGRIEHLDIAKNWRENNPVKSLAVPVGVGTDGSTVMLDLHQKFQGPHGLVAGTTGSGKSEFLLTYILSLALNFHPDEVAFVLIDYKGGGLAGAFDDPANGIHLPHLIATITNLDGSAISRSLISIQSEMTRRQRVFNEAKSSSGEGTMDIYTYQRLYRNKAVSEPMPHLFIISDEFAELKQ
ncbi:MAG: FHA domain-containing protein [Lachnospiraceae bacterium]|nr:FHA domain-containing protein [Lachnospiraceae bacterium]